MGTVESDHIRLDHMVQEEDPATARIHPQGHTAILSTDRVAISVWCPHDQLAWHIQGISEKNVDMRKGHKTRCGPHVSRPRSVSQWQRPRNALQHHESLFDIWSRGRLLSGQCVHHRSLANTSKLKIAWVEFVKFLVFPKGGKNDPNRLFVMTHSENNLWSRTDASLHHPKIIRYIVFQQFCLNSSLQTSDKLFYSQDQVIGSMSSVFLVLTGSTDQMSFLWDPQEMQLEENLQ